MKMQCKVEECPQLGMRTETYTTDAIRYEEVYDTETGKLLIVEKVAIKQIEEKSLASGVLQSGDIIRSITIGGSVSLKTG